jgi:AcrR family transcriptional regulator
LASRLRSVRASSPPYRHFPSLDELIPACGEITMQVVALTDPATMPALFEHATEPAERVERLVGEAFAIYERGAPELQAIRRDADAHPRVADDRDRLDATLSALVDTALGPLDATQQDRAVARAWSTSTRGRRSATSGSTQPNPWP